jgi:hypothetical protein
MRHTRVIVSKCPNWSMRPTSAVSGAITSVSAKNRLFSYFEEVQRVGARGDFSWVRGSTKSHAPTVNGEIVIARGLKMDGVVNHRNFQNLLVTATGMDLSMLDRSIKDTVDATVASTVREAELLSRARSRGVDLDGTLGIVTGTVPTVPPAPATASAGAGAMAGAGAGAGAGGSGSTSRPMKKASSRDRSNVSTGVKRGRDADGGVTPAAKRLKS